MHLLVESLCALDGQVQALSYHARRMAASSHMLWGRDCSGELEEALSQIELGTGRWKIRVIYSSEIQNVEAASYTAAAYQKVALLPMQGNQYAHKFLQRSWLEKKENQGRFLDCDTVLLHSGGFIKDFTRANVAFFDGQEWVTPLHPMLKGTRREALIDAHQLRCKEIRVEDLSDFSLCSPVNAMLPLGEIVMPWPQSLSRREL
ncbi:MAG: aminotransferase class IV [Spirochaetales bacterium]|nr:aminotransferase class IV [Spirochaetales bacterium]